MRQRIAPCMARYRVREQSVSKRVVLMANDTPGLEVTKHLVEHGDTIVRLYLHSGKFCKRGEEIRTASCCPDGAVFEDMFLKDPISSLPFTGGICSPGRS